VTGIDVLTQSVDDGVLKTERVIQSRFPIPGWASRLTGFSGTQYSREYTEIDPLSKRMILTTRNLNCSNFLRVDEKLTYLPHDNDPNRTFLTQEAVVSVNLPTLTDYCEHAFLNTYQNNAVSGRIGLEWVIDHVKREYNDISAKMAASSSEVVQGLLGVRRNSLSAGGRASGSGGSG